MNLEAERQGNNGRREWISSHSTPAAVAELQAMLLGACATIDKLVIACEEARAEGIGIGRLSNEVLIAELRWQLAEKKKEEANDDTSTHS